LGLDQNSRYFCQRRPGCGPVRRRKSRPLPARQGYLLVRRQTLSQSGGAWPPARAMRASSACAGPHPWEVARAPPVAGARSAHARPLMCRRARWGGSEALTRRAGSVCHGLRRSAGRSSAPTQGKHAHLPRHTRARARGRCRHVGRALGRCGAPHPEVPIWRGAGDRSRHVRSTRRTAPLILARLSV
jgi:hypothetical protein